MTDLQNSVEPGQIASEGYVLSEFTHIVQGYRHETFKIYWQISDFYAPKGTLGGI